MKTDRNSRRVAVITGALSGIEQHDPAAVGGQRAGGRLAARRADRIHTLAGELGKGGSVKSHESA